MASPHAMYKWLVAASRVAPAQRNRTIAATTVITTAVSWAMFEHNHKDNGHKRRESERVQRELAHHRSQMH